MNAFAKRLTGLIFVLAAWIPLVAAGYSVPKELAGRTFHRIDLPELQAEELTIRADGAFERVVIDGETRNVYSGAARFDSGSIGAMGAGPLIHLDTSVYGWTLSKDGALLALCDNEKTLLYSVDPNAEPYAGSFTASSELSETVRGVKRRYAADNLDGRDALAFWAEAEKGPGVGAWVERTLMSPYTGNADDMQPGWVVIVNGFPGDASNYAANARAKTIEANFDGAKVVWTLADSPRPQIFLAPDAVGASKVRFTVKEVYPGAKYEDLCISKILVIAGVQGYE